MAKYILTFSKTGTICYTSHLDMMKMFKRVFKRAGIKQSYSQGFNPHPKMTFAQPLSLGYWGLGELLEFETEEDYRAEFIKETLAPLMPEGIVITDCVVAEPSKTLAAMTEAAEYIIAVPLHEALDMDGEEIYKAYMGRDKILTYKKQKKKKELAEIDIKPMIRDISFVTEDETLFVTALLDSGSTSNLSPELVIATLLECMKLDTDRSEVQVIEERFISDNKLIDKYFQYM